MEFLSKLKLNQKVGLAFGAVYVLIGVIGFAVTGGIGFAQTTGNELIFFELNPLHNIVHIGVGAMLGFAAYAGAKQARLMNTLVGGVYFVVGVFGLFAIGTAANIIALNEADNLLHFVSATVLLGTGLFAYARSTVRPVAGEIRQTRQAAPRRERAGELVPGDEVPASGTYKCSCNDFAVFVRDGSLFPPCPEGDDHHFTLTSEATKKSA